MSDGVDDRHRRQHPRDDRQPYRPAGADSRETRERRRHVVGDVEGDCDRRRPVLAVLGFEQVTGPPVMPPIDVHLAVCSPSVLPGSPSPTWASRTTPRTDWRWHRGSCSPVWGSAAPRRPSTPPSPKPHRSTYVARRSDCSRGPEHRQPRRQHDRRNPLDHAQPRLGIRLPCRRNDHRHRADRQASIGPISTVAPQSERRQPEPRIIRRSGRAGSAAPAPPRTTPAARPAAL